MEEDKKEVKVEPIYTKNNKNPTIEDMIIYETRPKNNILLE